MKKQLHMWFLWHSLQLVRKDDNRVIYIKTRRECSSSLWQQIILTSYAYKNAQFSASDEHLRYLNFIGAQTFRKGKSK